MISLSRRSLLQFFAASAVVGASPARGQADATSDSDSPSIYTPPSVVDEIMKLAEVGPGDYVVDLGSGDGRLVIAAVARFNARGGFGVDISPMMVTLSNQNAEKAGVADRVKFYQRNLFATNVSDATVVTIYLLPSIMGRVEKKLRAELKPGTRIVCHDFPFPSWRAERVIGVHAADKITTTGLAFTQLYLYRVPHRG